jgi:hypothetical protein
VKRFRLNQHVRVVSADHVLAGWSGIVRRLRYCDNWAWVEMDRDLPINLQSFPADDDRHRNVQLDPAECEAVAEISNR